MVRKTTPERQNFFINTKLNFFTLMEYRIASIEYVNINVATKSVSSLVANSRTRNSIDLCKLSRATV